MSTLAIFDKYAHAMGDAGAEARPLSTDAVLLALRLAIGDAYAAGVDSVILNALDKLPPQKDSDQRQHESLQAQIARLNEWLAANQVALYHNPDLDTAAAMIQACEETMRVKVALHIERDNLHQQLMQMDADNARLIASLTAADEVQKTLRRAIADRDDQSDHLVRNAKNTALLLEERDRTILGLQAEIDRLTRQNTIAIDAFNTLVDERHANGSGNGNGANPTPAAQSPATDWGRNHLAWRGLDDEGREWVFDLHTGAKQFGQVPMTLRREMVRRVIAHLGGTTMREFDALKPAWMPGSNGLIRTFGCKWTELQAQSTP